MEIAHCSLILLTDFIGKKGRNYVARTMALDPRPVSRLINYAMVPRFDNPTTYLGSLYETFILETCLYVN